LSGTCNRCILYIIRNIRIVYKCQHTIRMNVQILQDLLDNNEVGGYASPSGRITYGKVVDKKSFAIFDDIITSLVPIDIITDNDKNNVLPSIALVIKSDLVYPRYLCINSTADEYMDYENEEDQDHIDMLFDHLKHVGLKKPIIGIAVQKNESMQSAHAVAFVCWKINHHKSKFAFYDPLAYKRGQRGFDYAEKAFKSSRFSQKIEFINLNEYCFKPNELGDFHCSQYIINAEYCYIYSIFFLQKWIEFGSKLTRPTFKKVIKSTYVVDPKFLTRTNNSHSMLYRIILMKCICNTLIQFLSSLTKNDKKYIKKSGPNIRRIKIYLKDFKTRYGFDLLQLDDSIPKSIKMEFGSIK
jgi:hypothetical protein